MVWCARLLRKQSCSKQQYLIFDTPGVPQPCHSPDTPRASPGKALYTSRRIATPSIPTQTCCLAIEHRILQATDTCALGMLRTLLTCGHHHHIICKTHAVPDSLKSWVMVALPLSSTHAGSGGGELAISSLRLPIFHYRHSTTLF
jgi:hypothetical protein